MKGIARTNAFRVKDEEGLRAWASDLLLLVSETTDEQGTKRFALHPDTAYLDDGMFPAMRLDEDDPEIDYAKELSAYLAEGEVAFMVSTASEGINHLEGWVVAITWDGRSCSLSTNDIYAMAVERLLVDPQRLTLAYEGGATKYVDNAGKMLFPAPQPRVGVIVAYGKDVIEAIAEGRKITDADSGCVEAFTLATYDEVMTYLEALQHRDGWDSHAIISAPGAQHPYFEAEREQPLLPFEDWHNQQVDRAD